MSRGVRSRRVTWGTERVTIPGVMDRSTFVVAAMAAGGAEARFDPVRLQKLFFLLDRELDGRYGCPHFDFRPYRYGPFDQAVYLELERLAREGLATIDEKRRYREYALTARGFERGNRALADLPDGVRSYFVAASEWVLSLHFRDLLASIYEYAPDMAARSVLPDLVPVQPPERAMSPFVRGMARSLDWHGTLSARRETGAAALGRQWAAVGEYLSDAMDQAARGRSGS